jgi:signal transduction histidine kinase
MQLRHKVPLLFHLGRPVLRVQLTLLYSGLFVALLAVVLLATGVLFGGNQWRIPFRVYSSQQAPAGASAAAQQTGPAHQFVVGPALISLVAVAVALLVAWWLAGRFLRPLRAITTTAQEISATNLHRRLGLNGPDDELTELGRTLDDLFGRLQSSFESQRHFVSNASHELRTPLAGQRTLLQVALADPDADAHSLRSTCEEALQLGAQQERLIDALLTLATSERGVERWEPFDLGKLADNVVLSRRQEAERRHIHVDAAPTETPATGDPSLVESLVANLVDNALRHNQAGGRVEVSTTTTAGRASISVSNTGALIPPDEVDRLFQPFQRLGDERIRLTDGHGLGLAIIRAIATAHGATLTARSRPEGGLDIEVSFPTRFPTPDNSQNVV